MDSFKYSGYVKCSRKQVYILYRKSTLTPCKSTDVHHSPTKITALSHNLCSHPPALAYLSDTITHSLDSDST